MNITENTSIADIAAALPSSVRIFEQHGVDFCCGGKKPIGLACEEQGLAFGELVAAIEASASGPAADPHDWKHESLDALIIHVVRTYHEAHRAELPRLQAIAAKVAQVHGAKASHLARIEEIVEELSEDLIPHMDKEELVLFPAIRALERGDAGSAADVALFVDALEEEHDRAGDLLAELRRLTDAYVAPEWGCNTVHTLYRELQHFEKAMHLHVHLENNVLFPRALASVTA